MKYKFLVYFYEEGKRNSLNKVQIAAQNDCQYVSLTQIHMVGYIKTQNIWRNTVFIIISGYLRKIIILKIILPSPPMLLLKYDRKSVLKKKNQLEIHRLMNLRTDPVKFCTDHICSIVKLQTHAWTVVMTRQ